jgi:oligopeptide/dipeptide ABC transporter ATP-binding protein
VTEVLGVEGLEVQFELRGGVFDAIRRRPPMIVRAVDKIDFSVSQGEILALVGESGSGKTTTGRTILQLERPTRGRIRLGGMDATQIRGPSQMRAYRKRVQMIFQDPYQALNPRQSVLAAVAEAVRGLGLAHSRSEIEERVIWALEISGLRPAADFLTRYPHELSGGQRQRVVIAGALVVKPELIVADEPVSMLDVSIRAQILEVLVELRRAHGVAFLFITHDLPVAWLISDRIAVMYLGKLVEVGEAQEVTFHPRHPYTRALVAAAPSRHFEVTRQAPPPLAGEVPNAANVPVGCRFHPRCPLAFARCRVEEPPLIEVSPTHSAACWLANELSDPPDVKIAPR